MHKNNRQHPRQSKLFDLEIMHVDPIIRPSNPSVINCNGKFMMFTGFSLDEIGFEYRHISEEEAKLWADIVVMDADMVKVDVIKWDNNKQEWISTLNKKEDNMSLDLTKILKGCEGMKFYHTLVGDYVTLCGINTDSDHPIRYTYDDGFSNTVSRYGKHWDRPNGECVFFPSKEQRDWSKFKKPLAVDTPVMVSTGGTDWALRFYAGDKSCFLNGCKSDEQVRDNWRYIVPVSEFDFENPESNKEKSI